MISDDLIQTYGGILAARNDSFEEKTIKVILARFRLKDAKWPMIMAHLKRTGEHKLKFGAFHAVLPNFPILLGVRQLRWQKNNHPLSRLMALKSAGALPLFQEHDDLCDCNHPESETKSVGLIVSWPYVPHGLVLHNFPVDLDQPGARMTWTFSKQEKRCLEPLDDLLTTLSKHPAKKSKWGFRPPEPRQNVCDSRDEPPR